MILNNLARQGVRDYFELNGAAVIGNRHAHVQLVLVVYGAVCVAATFATSLRVITNADAELAGAVMPTKQPRTHGTDDRLLCPECGGVMTAVEYDHADAFVWQTFSAVPA